MKKRYKFLRLKDNNIFSDSGNIVWKIGEWQKQEGEIKLCENGFHCSKNAYQAFSYVQGEILAVVEVRGESDIDDDKEAYAEMRIIKAYKWTKNDSIDLAVYSAQMVLENFEKQFPEDKRPREAIEAAIAYKKCPCSKHQSAAWSAGSAAWSAGSAGSAAESAARSAGSAAESAGSAAGSAAESAAWSAARSAARSAESATIKKITTWFTNHVKELEPYEV